MFVSMVVPAKMLAGNNELLPILPLIFGWQEPIFNKKLVGAVPCFKTWYTRALNTALQRMVYLHFLIHSRENFMK